MGKILAVLNQKGGVGKSTVCTNIGVRLASIGSRVLIVDTDQEQKSASRWAGLRHENNVIVVGITKATTLERDAKVHAKNYDVVIIDGTPGISELTVAAIRAADAILIPVEPSPKAVWGTETLVDLIRARQHITGGLPKTVFLVNGVKKGTLLAAQIDEALLAMNMPVLDARLHEAEALKLVDNMGAGVTEAFPASQSASDIDAIIRELQENDFL